MPSPLSLLSHAQSKLGSFLYYTPDIEAMGIRSTSTTSGGSDGLATPESLSPTFSPHDPVALSAAQLSQSRRGMLDLMNKLHSLGVNMDIDLPQIAVIGVQSAGKSSIIEAISGIKLPRAVGTCTRCPIECRLTHSKDPWKCVVSLRFVKDKSGKTLNPVETIEFGDPIRNPDEVEDRLRRAQAAILNPSTQYRKFLQANFDASPPEFTFSPNIVSVCVSGPNVADLSFVDLPGLIASVTKDGKDSDVKLIEDLLVSYIDKPSCIVLLTVACETDFETQGAYKLTTKYDPGRSRTIGVLTKPDRIARGNEERWAQFVMNKVEELKLGWYCAKQPDGVQLKEGISWDQARREEADFFENAQPWASLRWADQQRLGTPRLVEQLSNTLSELIRRRLPDLETELQTLIRRTRTSIAELPQPPSSDPLAGMIQKIADFTSELDRHLEGLPQPGGLLQRIFPHQKDFVTSIEETAPDFRTYEEPQSATDAMDITPCSSSDGRNDGSRPQMTNPSRVADTPGINTRGQKAPKPVSEHTMFINQVLEHAQSVRTRELPDNYPYAVRTHYIGKILQRWQDPADKYFSSVYGIMEEHLGRLIQKHFGQFVESGLLRHVMTLVSGEIEFCRNVTAERIGWLLRLESQPFTLNASQLATYKNGYLAEYRDERVLYQPPRLRNAISEYDQWVSGRAQKFVFGKPSVSPGTFAPQDVDGPAQHVGQVLGMLPGLGLTNVTASDLAKLLPPDRFDPALEIMAEVRAYFEVAHRRFVDNLPLVVDHDFVRDLGSRVKKAFYEGLIKGDDAYNRCRMFLQERNSDTARREELNTRLNRLLDGRRELMQI